MPGEAIVDYFVIDKKPPHKCRMKKVQKKNIQVTIDKERGIGPKIEAVSG